MTDRDSWRHGALSMALDDGTVITGNSDVQLATAWAVHAAGGQAEFDALPRCDQWSDIGAALRALGEAVGDQS